MRFSKKILCFCMTVLLIYTIASITYQCRTGVELAPILTERFFTVFGIEFGALALLKVAEINAENRQAKREREERDREARQRRREAERQNEIDQLTKEMTEDEN